MEFDRIKPVDVVIFFIGLSILVVVHEMGHFLAAKFCGVLVEEFGLGLPPRAWGRKIGETVFSLNWLPIGGFVKLFGEDPESGAKVEGREKTRTFFHKKPWQKALIVVGGVTMNLVLAIAIFSVVYSILGVPKETERVKVIGLAVGSPAQKAGLKEGDWVAAVNEIRVSKPSQLTDEVAKYKGGRVGLSIVSKDGESRRVEVEVREKPPAGEGSMGVAISNVEITQIRWYEIDKGIVAGFKEAYFWGKIIVEGVGKMVGGLLSGKIPSDVSGPIGMYQATTSIRQKQGLLALVHFFGIVSVNLAVVNILPFPALDGGRIIFVLYEFLLKRRPNQKFEMAINNFGMMFLLGLIFLITVADVLRVVR